MGSCEFEAGGFRFVIEWTGRGVSRLLFEKESSGTRGAHAELPPFVREAVAAVRAFFDEGRDVSRIRIDLAAMTEFDRRVVALLRRIPRGRATSYRAVAAAAGVPSACRAVGGAIGRNPLPVIFPCHRVVLADGRLGGFSAPGGAEVKKRLLRLEGVGFRRDAVVEPAHMLDSVPVRLGAGKHLARRALCRKAMRGGCA
ncbi:MAG: methylated-DNA--[protein]-cysteine S-methyltransferase [Deltaproteobacteria bacterium]|nr:methylated-DNA--[protein]-cysteine S-methyltransferase [Deltaproteobacteria bacterium]